MVAVADLYPPKEVKKHVPLTWVVTYVTVGQGRQGLAELRYGGLG